MKFFEDEKVKQSAPIAPPKKKIFEEVKRADPKPHSSPSKPVYKNSYPRDAMEESMIDDTNLMTPQPAT